MILKDLLQRIHILETIGTLALSEVEVSELVFDSRKVVENSLYVALKGTISDGHSYINQSIEKGAKTIVCEELPSEINEEVTYLKVENTSKTLRHFTSNIYKKPSKKKNIIKDT